MNRTGLVLVLFALVALVAAIAYATLREGDGIDAARETAGRRGPRESAPPVAPPPLPAAPPAVPRTGAGRPAGDGPAIVTGLLRGPDGEVVKEPSVRSAGGILGLDPERKFALAVEESDVELTFSARDLLPREVPVRGLAPGEVRDLGEVRLTPGLSVAGRVLDTDGKPAAAVEIVAGSTTRVTDANGDFRFGGLPPDEVAVAVDSIGYRLEGEPKKVRPPVADLRLVVRRLRVATGLVVVSGEDTGIGGATVRLIIRLGEGEQAREEARLVQTLDDGRFAFDLSEPGYDAPELRFTVRAAADGFEEGAREDLELASLLPGAGFALPLLRGVPAEPGRLRGRVLYDTGLPFAGTVTLSFHRPGRAGQILRVESNEEGEYVVDGVLPGEYALKTAYREEEVLRDAGRTLVIPPGGEATADLVVPRGGDVGVTVEDENGEPVKGASVAILADDGTVRHTYPIAEGSLRIFDLPPGAIVLQVSAPGRRPETVEARVSRDEVTPVRVRLGEER